VFLRVVEQRDGGPPDLVGGPTHINQVIGNYDYLLFEDPVFEELALQPVALTLADYLLGVGCIINVSAGIVKGPTEMETPGRLLLPLHSDNQMQPSPFVRYAEVANVTWILSDYDEANGALAYVPGSHTLARHPLKGEADHLAIPVEAPAGSLIVWHGNTWHGGFPRSAPGLRMSCGYLMSRPHIVPRQPFRDDITPEMLERNPARFAKLMGKHLMVGWRTEGPFALRGPDKQAFFDTVFA
jgi:ectoine hydroxylase-related dioxygenase (phytanoyl-CoA dioxygenase family)